ncbi:heme ABC exporter ATP-binding protein CcmA [Usitatibacter palustris]|uniref:Cytochrome c biogenesis ATP-binding export protein CcmA n=1 Tax=Usitatibacter palustris TaxID=2732487 RepID=A0A6M4H9E2_9PROT|nr:heme ABC exporter ATP-binding protein CcmA [Usitatibacter palustris]QJR15014.1 Cytochrome c biogenesis ATP-binding export protein CcmA [Usitatibacter palustris]
MSAASLEVRSLAASRGPVNLFSGISFRLSGGEALCVRGANGSGKTTLLRCAAGLTRPDAGEVQRDADFIYAGHLAGIKDDLTAEENLRFALRLRAVDAPVPAIAEALRAVGLESRRALPARRLSAGQRRRIGLARLALDPAPLWILDEPLTALDGDGEQLFAQGLARHLGRGGLALIATHHDLGSGTTKPQELRL